MGFIDNLLAMRILMKLVTPFDQTDAFKLGIIDASGKILKQVDTLQTFEEKDAYDMLDRLVFNMKRLLGKLPGGESKLKNLAAAYFLVREHLDNDELTDDMIMEQLTLLSQYHLVEETLVIVKFVAMYEDGSGGDAGGKSSDLAVNSAAKETSTDEPVFRKKKPKMVTRGAQITQAEIPGL